MATSQILRPVAAVVADVQRVCRPTLPRPVPIEDAVGQVLAEDLASPDAVPLKPIALRSGYAVNAADLVGVSAYAPLAVPGELVPVGAGDPLPAGCDAVIPPDAVQVSGTLTEIVATVAPGESVRRTGEDARAGTALLKAGALLRPQDAAVASAAGIRSAVVRQAVIGLFAQSDEKAVAGILLAGTGGARVQAEADDAGMIPARGIETTGLQVDILVVVTHASEAVTGHATSMLAHGLALRPGERTQVGLVDAMPLVVVPPWPDALFAVSRCLLAPLVASMTFQQARQPALKLPLGRKLSSTIGLTEVALLREESGRLWPLGIGALSLPALAQADAWLAIPPESEGYGEGEIVEAATLGRLAPRRHTSESEFVGNV